MANNVEVVITAKDYASKTLDNLKKNTNSFQNNLIDWFKRLSAATALAWVWIAWYWLKVAWELQQTRIAFDTMLWSAEKWQKMLQELSDFAKTTPFEFPEVARAWKSLLAFWFEAEKIQENLRMLWDIASWLNIPFTELSEIYWKIRVQGRLYAEDMNQLTGRWIPVIQELAKQFKVSENEIKKMVETWKVWFPEIEKAFKSLTWEWSKFGWMMEKQSQTLNGQLSTLKDNLTQALTKIMWINSNWDVVKWWILDRTNTIVWELNKRLQSWELDQSIESLTQVIAFCVKAILLWAKAIKVIWEALWNLIMWLDEASSSVANFMNKLPSLWFNSGANFTKMLAKWISGWIPKIENASNQLMSTVSDYMEFHSPTKKWPWSTADKWMPNLVNMLAQWLRDWETKLKASAIKLASVLWFLTWKSLSIEDMKKTLESLKWVFENAFWSLNSNIDESKSKLSSLKDELKDLKSKFSDLWSQLSETITWWRTDLANRAVELEKEILNLKNEEWKQEEILNKEKELALAKQYITEEEFLKAKEEAWKSETQKLIDSISLKMEAINKERAEIQKQMLEKQQAITTEEELYKSLNDKKIEFENQYFQLFKSNLEETKLWLQQSIDLMNRLNSAQSITSEQSMNYKSSWNNLFVPNSSNISNATSNAVNVNINMGWVVANNNTDVNWIAEAITQRITRAIQLQKLAIN